MRAGVDVLEEGGGLGVGHSEHARTQRRRCVTRRDRDLLVELGVGHPLAVQQRPQADERVLGAPLLLLGAAAVAGRRPTSCAGPSGR